MSKWHDILKNKPIKNKTDTIGFLLIITQIAANTQRLSKNIKASLQ